MICSRCLSNLNLDNALGGSYGGVVCLNHRICPDCWWNIDEISINKGARKNENKSTKNIAIVNNPRKDYKVRCYGCLYNAPYINSDINIVIIGKGNKREPIIIN